LMENPALNLARFARRTGTMLTYSTQLLYNTQLAALPYSRYIPLLDVFDKATQEAYQAFLDQDTGDGSLVNDKTRLNAAKSFATTVALENLPELLISILPQRPRIESDEIKQIIQGIGFTQEVGAVARYLERYIPNIESKALRFAQTLNTPEGRARAIQLLQVVVPESDYFYKRISEEELFSSSQSSTASSLPELDVVLAANQIARSTWQAGQAARARIEQNLGINANPVNRVTKDPVGDYMVVMLSDGARFQKRLALLQNGNWSAAELEELNLTEEKALEKRQKLAGLSVSPDEAFLIGATFFALKDFLALKKP